VRKNHLNVGVVPSGAVVERSVPIQLAQDGTLTWRLHRPDFTTARLLAAVINDSAGQVGGSPQMARALDGGSVRVDVGAVPEEALPEGSLRASLRLCLCSWSSASSMTFAGSPLG